MLLPREGHAMKRSLLDKTKTFVLEQTNNLFRELR